MKRKFLLPILSICMVVALVSVGFAAWLITGNDTVGAEGQFVTYAVSNEFFTVRIDEVRYSTGENSQAVKYGAEDYSTAEGKNVIFGKLSTGATTGWLQADDLVEVENLTKDFTITIVFDAITVEEDTNNTKTAAILNKYNLGFTLKADTDGKFKTAAGGDNTDDPNLVALEGATDSGNVCSTTGSVLASDFYGSKGYVVSIDYLEMTKNTEKDSMVTYTADITVTFKWGTYFGENSTNPYTFYNGSHFDDGDTSGFKSGQKAYDNLSPAAKKALREDAQTKLSTIKDINGKKFSINPTASVKQSN